MEWTYQVGVADSLRDENLHLIDYARHRRVFIPLITHSTLQFRPDRAHRLLCEYSYVGRLVGTVFPILLSIVLA